MSIDNIAKIKKSLKMKRLVLLNTLPEKNERNY